MATTDHRKLKEGLKPRDDGREAAPGDLPLAVVDLSTPGASSAPGLPNDRDETVGMTGGIPSERIEQARVDVERGLVDTTRAEESDKAYQRQKKTDV